MKLSVVATLYRSAATVVDFHRGASDAARRLVDDDYEIVLVNDGSPDTSLALAVALTTHDPHLVVVDLSRNFGHHKAMMTGLSHAHGERVFLIDSDLEEDPAWLLPFAARMADEPCDVVFGVQAARKGGWFERWSGEVYYGLMRVVSRVDMPRNMVTARLMTRRYVDALLRHEEREFEIGGLWAVTGFAQRPCVVVKRSSSASTYTLRHRLAIVIDAVTSFSTTPLTAILCVGIASFAATLTMMVVMVGQSLSATRSPAGWQPLLASVWLFGSLILAGVGVVGLYVGKILAEVKRRPYTIVRDIHGRHAER